MRLLVFSLISSIKAEDNQWNQIERFDGIELAGADGPLAYNPPTTANEGQPLN